MAEWNLLTTKAHPSGKMEPFFWVTKNPESTHAFKQLSLSLHSPPAQASIRPSGRHPSPPLRSRHLRTCSTLAGAKSLSKRGRDLHFRTLGHSADATAFLRRNRSPAWGDGVHSAEGFSQYSTPLPRMPAAGSSFDRVCLCLSLSLTRGKVRPILPNLVQTGKRRHTVLVR